MAGSAAPTRPHPQASPGRQRVKGQRRWWALVAAVAAAVLTGYGVFASLLAVTGRAGTGLQAGTDAGAQVTVGCQQAPVSVRPTYREDFSAASGFDVPLTGFEISGVQQSCVTADTAWVLAVQLGGSFQELPDVLVLKTATPVREGVYAVGPGPITSVASMGITGYSIRAATAETPGAPTGVTVTAGDGQVSVAFTAPASGGSSAITNYEFSTDGGTTWTTRSPVSTVSPLTITGLTNGTTYQVAIRAVNTVGAGAPSAAVAATPQAPLAVVAFGGNDYYYQLGNGGTAAATSPTATTATWTLAGDTAVAVSAGYHHSCALDSTGRAYCWGHNDAGRLGDGTTTNRSAPVAVDTAGVLNGKTLTQISAGLHHTCALDTAGKAYCWGYGEYGQLGNGNWTAINTTPVAVSTTGALAGKTLTQISAGMGHTCALDTDAKAYCWGSNVSGRIGDGTVTNRNTPVAVSGNNSYTQISAGNTFTCAITTAGVAHCWGENSVGQLGLGWAGQENYRATPQVVTGGHNFSQISASLAHACAVTAAPSPGQVRCWGYNGYGGIGDGTTTDRYVPTLVSGLAGRTMTTVGAGDGHACAVDTTAKAYCWGRNNYGQLGDGTTTQRLTAVAVTGNKSFTQLSVGRWHNIGIARDAS